jgi:SAM-dependent methyltransferase
MAGDFGVIARSVNAGAQEFVASLDLPKGARVLDVACGTGNTAIPLAQRGCHVTGLDVAPNLLEQARGGQAPTALPCPTNEPWWTANICAWWRERNKRQERRRMPHSTDGFIVGRVGRYTAACELLSRTIRKNSSCTRVSSLNSG